MPSHYVIPSLFDLVGDRVWKWILKTATSLSGPAKVQRFRDLILTNLNSNIRQQLLDKVMDTHMYDYDVQNKCFMIELLADKSITRIDLTRTAGNNVLFINEVYQFYRTVVMAKLTELQILRLVCSIKAKREEIYINDVNSTFFQGLRKMTELRFVKVTSIADTEFMKILGSNCRHLEYLDVSGSSRIEDESIASLLVQNDLSSYYSSDQELTPTDVANMQWHEHSCCSYIRFLGLSETEVSSFGITLSLRLLPSLRSFGGYFSNGSVSKCILQIRTYLPTKVFPLAHLWDCTFTEAEVSCIDECCPRLSSVSTGSIDTLCPFANLKSLTIDADFKNIETDFLDLLKVIGDSLTTLILQNSINTLIDLELLAECIPNITKLELPLECEDQYEKRDLMFPYLKEANVSFASSKSLFEFLKISPALSSLKLGFIANPYGESSDSITDDLLISALAEGALKHLKEFRLEECSLGDEGLSALLQACPNLNYIEKLIYWKNVSKVFIQELRSKIVTNNWDLKLVLKERWSDMSLEDI